MFVTDSKAAYPDSYNCHNDNTKNDKNNNKNKQIKNNPQYFTVKRSSS